MSLGPAGLTMNPEEAENFEDVGWLIPVTPISTSVSD